LINVARAQIVNREGLFTSLAIKKIVGAAFDVFWGKRLQILMIIAKTR
jgi:phosphoglycerate dehydrogenase-like enzyme